MSKSQWGEPQRGRPPRFLRAYAVALQVLSSYLWVSVRRRLLGEAWIRPRMPAIHKKNARRIEQNILKLKGLFIKVGQMLSILSNFLPEELRAGLEGLQDQVPPHPFPAIEKRFLQEFQKRPQEIFRLFEETPIASASLGQVHRAELPDGTPVAVKVQYPEIERIVHSDLTILKRIFSLLHLFLPTYGLRQVYEEIAQVILQELDYVYEGKNLETLRKNFENEKEILFPDVFWNYSTSRILTLRFMEGTKISQVAALKKMNLDPAAIATKILHATCKQIFLDGVYHADPHPGNLLVRPDGKVVLVDFGAMARVSEPMRAGMARFAEGLIKRDTRILASAMREMGFVAREEGMEPFEKLVDYFYGKLTHLKIENFQNLNLVNLQNVEELLELKKLKISFRELMGSFHVPRDWVLLERTMLLVIGLTAHLAPQLNPMEIVLPYIEKFVLKDRPVAEVLITLTKEIGLSYLRLPHEIQKALRRLNEGRINLSHPDLKGQLQRLYILGHQFLYAGLSIGGIFLGLRLEELGFLSGSRYAYLGSGLLGLVLLISIVRNRRS